MASSDPITQEIIQNSLQAAADEMFVAMRKTAMKLRCFRLSVVADNARCSPVSGGI